METDNTAKYVCCGNEGNFLMQCWQKIVMMPALPNNGSTQYEVLTRSLQEPGGPCTKSMEVQNLVWNGLNVFIIFMCNT